MVTTYNGSQKTKRDIMRKLKYMHSNYRLFRLYGNSRILSIQKAAMMWMGRRAYLLPCNPHKGPTAGNYGSARVE